MQTDPALADFSFHATDKLRFGDMDRQGHVNNVTFLAFFETGRVEFLYDPDDPLAPEGCSFVVARIALDFRAEILWPGTVVTGTRIAGLGRSSVRIEQAIFQDERCCAFAESVVVLTDNATRRSTPITEAMIERLSPHIVTASR